MSNPDADEMKRIAALGRTLFGHNGAFSDMCRKVEKMSNEKTLGQVAHAAFTEGYELADHYLVDAARWERAAQAVKSACGNTQEGIAQSQTTWRAGYERGLAQGAAEERGRLAAMFADMPRDDLSPMGVAETIRKSVKP